MVGEFRRGSRERTTMRCRGGERTRDVWMGEVGRHDRLQQTPRISRKVRQIYSPIARVGPPPPLLRVVDLAPLLGHVCGEELRCPIAGPLHQRPDLIWGISRAKDQANRWKLVPQPLKPAHVTRTVSWLLKNRPLSGAGLINVVVGPPFIPRAPPRHA